MKKIVNILLAAFVAVMAVSCEKFLDSKSPSTFDAATVYSNYSLTENTIFSIAQRPGIGLDPVRPDDHQGRGDGRVR